MSPRAAVIGGGITGLVAAYQLRRSEPDLEVTLYEASTRLGGKLRTAEVDGLWLETGADAFLVRDPDAVDLCAELGLDGDLVEPAVQGVEVRMDGRAHPLPSGLILGAPSRFGPLFRSPVVSTGGALRATLDVLLPREVDVDHESVAELIEHRFGREVLERLVEPMLAGVYAGDPARLGAAAATPRLAEAAREHRSLARGLRRTGERGSGGSIFRALRGGFTTLVDRLAEHVDVAMPVRIQLIEREGDRFALRAGGDETYPADLVIVAVPAYVAGALLRELVPAASDALREITYVSVANVITVHTAGSVALRGSGMLVPEGEAEVVKALSYVSNKWPHVAPDRRIVIRSSVGRRGAEDPVGWDDERLTASVLDDLDDILGVDEQPTAVGVTRWDRAIPQYEPAHLDRLDRLHRALADHPRIAVAGAAYGGVGITACVQDARDAAERVVGGLSRIAA
ncbi:MAG: protoporphyrinogen oxidase [Actinobacteria bacterium]|nr:protoporphyrinogen oxidase [Actinomycetota bacterium]